MVEAHQLLPPEVGEVLLKLEGTLLTQIQRVRLKLAVKGVMERPLLLPVRLFIMLVEVEVDMVVMCRLF
jgi:hypothetical protein